MQNSSFGVWAFRSSCCATAWPYYAFAARPLLELYEVDVIQNLRIWPRIAAHTEAPDTLRITLTLTNNSGLPDAFQDLVLCRQDQIMHVVVSCSLPLYHMSCLIWHEPCLDSLGATGL